MILEELGLILPRPNLALVQESVECLLDRLPLELQVHPVALDLRVSRLATILLSNSATFRSDWDGNNLLMKLRRRLVSRSVNSWS